MKINIEIDDKEISKALVKLIKDPATGIRELLVNELRKPKSKDVIKSQKKVTFYESETLLDHANEMKERDKESYDATLPILSPHLKPNKKGMYYDFWHDFLAFCSSSHASTVPFYNVINPPQQNYLTQTSNRTGISYACVLAKEGVRIEIFIQSKDKNFKHKKDLNERILKILESHKVKIEKTFGKKINWDILTYREACRISFIVKTGSIFDNANRDIELIKWNERGYLYIEMIKHINKFEKSFRPFVDSLNIKNIKDKIISEQAKR